MISPNHKRLTLCLFYVINKNGLSVRVNKKKIIKLFINSPKLRSRQRRRSNEDDGHQQTVVRRRSVTLLHLPLRTFNVPVFRLSYDIYT